MSPELPDFVSVQAFMATASATVWPLAIRRDSSYSARKTAVELGEEDPFRKSEVRREEYFDPSIDR